ncbi:hypothetical protein P7C70_g940, partial [Phenoliferia sp. Uapishka_3]
MSDNITTSLAIPGLASLTICLDEKETQVYDIEVDVANRTATGWITSRDGATLDIIVGCKRTEYNESSVILDGRLWRLEGAWRGVKGKDSTIVDLYSHLYDSNLLRRRPLVLKRFDAESPDWTAPASGSESRSSSTGQSFRPTYQRPRFRIPNWFIRFHNIKPTVVAQESSEDPAWVDVPHPANTGTEANTVADLTTRDIADADVTCESTKVEGFSIDDASTPILLEIPTTSVSNTPVVKKDSIAIAPVAAEELSATDLAAVNACLDAKITALKEAVAEAQKAYKANMKLRLEKQGQIAELEEQLSRLSVVPAVVATGSEDSSLANA